MIAKYQAIATDQNAKKEELKAQAEQAQKNYDALNYRDDQFDLASAAIAIAIALLAVTALTHSVVAVLPRPGAERIRAGDGPVGICSAGRCHPDVLIRPLT